MALGASPETAEASLVALWRVGCALVVLSGVAVGVAALTPRLRLPALFAASVTAALGVIALLARQPELHLSPFTHTHEHFAGLPTGLVFAGMAAAALALRSDRTHGNARIIFAGSTLLGVAALAWPVYWLTEATVPLTRALDLIDAGGALAGALLLLCSASVAAALVVLVRSGPPSSVLLGGAAAGLLLIVAHHLLAGWITPDAPAGAGWAGVAVAGGLMTATLAVGGWLRQAATEDVQVWQSPYGKTLEFGAVAGALALFLLLKTHGMGPSNTDENIYFYMAAQLADGQWPYIDYFFAHPPLHVLVPGLWFTVFDFDLVAAKSFSVVAAAITGTTVYAIGRHWMGAVAGVVAMVAFLFASETLKASTNMTGINLTTMWLTLGIYQGFRGRGLLAGTLYGAAACTGFYSMAAICGMLTLGLFKDRRFAQRQLLGFGAVFGVINLGFLVVAGDSFVDGVYRYHGLKGIREADMVPLLGGDMNPVAALLHNLGVMVSAGPFTKDVYYHGHLWTAALVTPLLGALVWFRSGAERSQAVLRFFDPRRLWDDDEDGIIAMVWLLALALFVQYAMFRELYSFYFVLIYPTLSLCLAWLLTRSVRLVSEAAASGWGGRSRVDLLAGGLVALMAFSLWMPWTAKANEVFGSEMKGKGQRNEYVWRDADALTGLSGVVHALFWRDHRLKGNIERGYHHYLWTKKRRFEKARTIADWIAERSEPHETIAGGSGAAPLLALWSGRKLAAGEADTNSKRYKAARKLVSEANPATFRRRDKTGLVTDEDYWNAICADDVRFIVSLSATYFTPQKMKQDATPRTWFEQAHVFLDEELKYGRKHPVYVFERKGEPPADGVVCRWE